MSTVFRAKDQPVATRLDYWLHAVDQTFGPVSVRPPADARLPVQLVVGDLGAVRVAETTISKTASTERCQATRTPRLISRADAEQYRIDVAVRGHLGVEQDGRRSSLRSGDFHLVDLSRPARWVSSAERWVAVTFPRALLPLRRDEVARLTAVRIPGDQGAGALVSSFARQLAGRVDDFGASDGAGSAPPWSTCSPWRWRPASTATSRRRRAPSGRCCRACTRSSRSGSPTPS